MTSGQRLSVLPLSAFRSLARTHQARTEHAQTIRAAALQTARRNTDTAIYQGKRIGEAPPGTGRQVRAPRC